MKTKDQANNPAGGELPARSDLQPHRLILNAAEGVIQFVITTLEDREQTIRTSQEWHAPSQGAELLAPALENAFSLLAVTPAHIREIACVTGPGSFTGIRLTLATATGLSLATGTLQGGIPYLPLLAAGAKEAFQAVPQGKKPPNIWVATHARNNLVHIQGFTETGALLTEVLVLSPEEALREIVRVAPDTPALLLGSGITRNIEVWQSGLSELYENSRILPASFNAPSPALLAEAAQKARYSAFDVAPLYVRASDAEENLAHIAGKLGLDPKAAIKRLDGLTSSLKIES